MENSEEQLEALKDIRQMMKQSNRFLSLSGFSGIFVGIYALIGAYFGNHVINNYFGNRSGTSYEHPGYFETLWNCILICSLVLVLSLVTAFIFSKRKAAKHGYNL